MDDLEYNPGDDELYRTVRRPENFYILTHPSGASAPPSNIGGICIPPQNNRPPHYISPRSARSVDTSSSGETTDCKLPSEPLAQSPHKDLSDQEFKILVKRGVFDIALKNNEGWQPGVTLDKPELTIKDIKSRSLVHIAKEVSTVTGLMDATTSLNWKEWWNWASEKQDLDLYQLAKYLSDGGGTLSSGMPVKVAKQSSTDYGGDASKAIDGNTSVFWDDNSITQTKEEKQPWWELDLGEEEYIHEIEIYNRSDLCCFGRLSDFYVFTSENRFDNATLSDLKNNRPDVYKYYHAGTAYAFGPNYIPVKHKARYIRIQLANKGMLSLAEVEVTSSTVQQPKVHKDGVNRGLRFADGSTVIAINGNTISSDYLSSVGVNSPFVNNHNWDDSFAFAFFDPWGRPVAIVGTLKADKGLQAKGQRLIYVYEDGGWKQRPAESLVNLFKDDVYSKDSSAPRFKFPEHDSLTYGDEIFAAHTWSGSRKMYIFRSDGKYVRIDKNSENKNNDDDYPRTVDDDGWPGLGAYARKISAALHIPSPYFDDYVYYFLSDGTLVRYNATDDRLYPGNGPFLNGWKGYSIMGKSVPTAILGVSPETNYFFMGHGGLMIDYSITNTGIPVPYRGKWKKVEDVIPALAPYANAIVAAIKWNDDEYHFFIKGNNVVTLSSLDQKKALFRRATDVFPGILKQAHEADRSTPNNPYIKDEL